MVCAPHRFTIIGMAKGLTNTGYKTHNSTTTDYKQDLNTIIGQPIRKVYQGSDFVKEKYGNENSTTQYTLLKYTPIQRIQKQIFKKPATKQTIKQTYKQANMQEDYSMKQTKNELKKENKNLKKEKQELAKKVLEELEKMGLEIPALHTHENGITH